MLFRSDGQALGRQSTPHGKREHADQILFKLREAELELAKGKDMPEAAWKNGVTEQAYYRWTEKRARLPVDGATRLINLDNVPFAAAGHSHIAPGFWIWGS